MMNVYWVYVGGEIIGRIIADSDEHAKSVCEFMYGDADVEFAYVFNRHLVRK